MIKEFRSQQWSAVRVLEKLTPNVFGNEGILMEYMMEVGNCAGGLGTNI